MYRRSFGTRMRYLNFPSPLIVLVGPTAVGKTEFSIRLAQRIDAEIISADSRLFYKGMDIGTAKPTVEERGMVPHHLIDIAEPDEIMSLAVFQQQAEGCIDEIHTRNRLPILVGGTGQYIRAVIEGWKIPPQPARPLLRKALEAWALETGKDGMHSRLRIIDPEAAKQIDPANLRRTIRALEVIFLTGQKFSTQRQRTARPYSLLIIGLTRPRPELYQRIDQRIDEMVRKGLVNEVKGLLQKGYSPDLPSLSAIGYREIIRYLNNEITLEEAVVLIKRSTRQFVRRQANWFKADDPAIRWFDMTDDVLDRVESYIRSGEGWIPAEVE